MSRALKARLARLGASDDGPSYETLLAKIAFVEWVRVSCEHEEYAEREYEGCGPAFVTIRATTYERYRAKIEALKQDGFFFMEC